MKKHIFSIAAGCLAMAAVTGCSVKINSSSEVVEAPNLTIGYAEQETEATRGAYDWKILKNNKEASVYADGDLLAAEDVIANITLQEGENTAELTFSVEPDEVEVYCWPAADRESASQENGTEVPVTDNTIELESTASVYWVNATWERDDCEGYVQYSFCAE